MKRLAVTGGALALAFIQASVFANGVPGSIYPDLVMVWVVAVSLAAGADEAAWWGFWSGMLLDTFSAAPFGVFTLSLLLIAFLAGLGESNIYRSSFLLPLLAGLIASAIYYLLLFFFLVTLGGEATWWASWRAVGLACLMNTGLMLLAYKVAEWLFARRLLSDTH